MALTPIAAAWEAFSSLSRYQDATPEEMQDTRKVFYSAATMIFRIMMETLSPDGCEPEQDQAFINLLADEIEDFIDTLEPPEMH